MCHLFLNENATKEISSSEMNEVMVDGIMMDIE